MHKSFFHAVDAPYYIVAPDYSPFSAGIRVMHQLCHLLNELGQEAYISCNVVNVALRTPVLTQEIANLHAKAGRQAIAVYPEVVKGNPLQAKKVVRYILNTPGHIGGDTEYPATDKLFVYDPYFLPKGMAAEVLTIPNTDDRTFNNANNDETTRTDSCVYALKYQLYGHKIMPAHETCIDLAHPYRDHEAFSALLRRSKLLYCYEPTGAAIDALLCGCVPVYVLSTYMPKRPGKILIKNDVICTIKWGKQIKEADFLKAKVNLPNYIYKYQQLKKQAWVQLNRFVELTQSTR